MTEPTAGDQIFSSSVTGSATVGADRPARAADNHERRLETDTFCSHCGYNLFSAEVRRDERLGILVCRCPECGQFHAAGQGASANRLLLQRFSTGYLVLYVLICLGVIFMMGAGLVAIQGVFLDNSTDMQYSGPYNSVPTVRLIKQLPLTDYAGNPESWRTELTPIVVVSGLLSLGMGMFIAIILWHRKRAAYLGLLLFVLIYGISTLITIADPLNRLMKMWATERFASLSAFDAVVFLIGLWIGRPAARVAVSLIVPPRAKQIFAFLWSADGKRLRAP